MGSYTQPLPLSKRNAEAADEGKKQGDSWEHLSHLPHYLLVTGRWKADGRAFSIKLQKLHVPPDKGAGTCLAWGIQGHCTEKEQPSPNSLKLITTVWQIFGMQPPPAATRKCQVAPSCQRDNLAEVLKWSHSKWKSSALSTQNCLKHLIRFPSKSNSFAFKLAAEEAVFILAGLPLGAQRYGSTLPLPRWGLHSANQQDVLQVRFIFW